MRDKKLPTGWDSLSLDEISDFVIGGDWGKDPESQNDVDDYVPVACIRGSEIKNWRADKGKTASIRLIKKSSLEKRQLRSGDLLIEISGGGPDQPVGRVILIDQEALAQNTEYPKIGTNFLRLIRISDGIDNRFVNYYLQNFYQTGEIIEYQGGSNNLRNLKYKEFSKIQIPLAPLPEQQRIVAKLDAIFGHMDVLRKKLDWIPVLLKNFRQQVLTQAVSGELTREWREGKDLGEWNIEKADKCCIKVQSGGTPKSDGFADTGIPFLKVYNIVNNKINFEYKPQFVTPEAHGTKIKKSILLPGDVLMNIVGPPLNKIAIVPDDYEEWNLNQAITLFRTKGYLSNKFLYYFFCEGSSVRSVHNETRGVVGQVNISLSQCRNFDIPVPGVEEQQEIVNRVDALFELSNKIESQYQILKAKIEQLPQAILAKAFKGELVGQEVKEYQREEAEVMMAAEAHFDNKEN